MTTYEIQGADGKTYEVQADDPNSAVAAVKKISSPPSPNPDGTYGQPPEGMVLNPKTGQMEDMRSPINPNIPHIGGAKTTAAALGGLQGLGFGFGDEAVAGASSIGQPPGTYDYNLARMREAERRAQNDNAGSYYAGLIPGAIASSLAGWGAAGVEATAPSLMGTMARGAGMGAAEGALYGAGVGEGTKDRLSQAIRGGAAGATVGGLAPAAIAGGAKVLGAGRDLVEGGAAAVTGKARQGAANRTLMATLKRSGHYLDDVANAVEAAAREGQPEFRTMDAMGKAGQRRASGIVRSGGDGAEELANFLEGRQLDQPSRLGGFVNDAFNGNQVSDGVPMVPGSVQDVLGRKATAKQTEAALKAARSKVANEAYDAARKSADPVDIRGALATIDDKIGGMQGSGIKGDGIDSKLASFRSRLAANAPEKSTIGGGGNSAVELSDFDRVLGVKQDVQDAIEVARRAGRGNEARELGKLSSQLDQALEAASPDYRAANDGFRKASRTIDAIETGKGMGRTSTRAQDNLDAFMAMTPEQQAAARVGYGDQAITKIEGATAPTANRAKMFTSPKAMQEADVIANNPQLFMNRIRRENAMWETQNRALGGSRTADNMADQEGVGALANAGRAIGSAMHGNVGNAIGNVAAMAGSALKGENAATKALIAKALMSSNPREALSNAIAQEATSQGRRRIAEAVARALGRPMTN